MSVNSYTKHQSATINSQVIILATNLTHWAPIGLKITIFNLSYI